MHRVLVIGGGPAGLAAAETLLRERRRRVQVTLLTDRAYLGGKAGSWEHDDGRVVENGQHITMGFYEELPALLARAGVSHQQTTVSNHGRFVIWEDRDQRAHDLRLGPSTLGTLIDGLKYTGWTLREKIGFCATIARIAPQIISGVPESWDDLCLTALCIEHGLPRSIFATNGFRCTRDAQLNYPGEISAYSMLCAIRRAGRDFLTSEARFPAGGMSRVWWEPVAARVEALGGRILRMKRLVALEHRDQQLTGLVIGESQCAEHDDEPCQHGSERPWRGFDAAILAIPPAALAKVLERSPGLAQVPALAGAGKLRPVVPLGLHVWHRAMAQPRHRTVVAGMAPPLEFVVDNKPFYEEYRDDTRFGACLHFVGQEGGYEHLDDEAVLVRAMTALRRIPGYEHLDDAGILSWQVVRNRLAHQRYWNGEPGSLRHKPWPKTPIERLWLAGDWIRNEFDFPCMEAAVHSGTQTAELVLESLDRQPARGELLAGRA
jgi:protoporphyrinogen oxidase